MGMGIIVPDLVIEDQGLSLPNAYIAISKNTMVLNPTANVFGVFTSYNMWASLQARLDGKKPINMMPTSVSFTWSGPTSAPLDDLYGAAYDTIKATYPTFVDEQPSAEPV